MAGVAAALAGSGAPSSYSGTPGTVSWSNASGIDSASTNAVTLSGISGAMSVTAANSGSGSLLYTLDGASSYYTGAFLWPEGSSLSWTVNAFGSSVAGTVTVTNASASETLATFTYSVRASSGGGGGIDP